MLSHRLMNIASSTFSGIFALSTSLNSNQLCAKVLRASLQRSLSMKPFLLRSKRVNTLPTSSLAMTPVLKPCVFLSLSCSMRKDSMLSGCMKHKSEQRSSISQMIRCFRKYQSAFSFSWFTLFINQQNYMSSKERSNLGLPGTINSLRLTRRNELSRWVQLSNRIEFIKRRSEKCVKARVRKQLLDQRLKEINRKTQVQRQFNQSVIKEIRQNSLKDSRNKLIKMKDSQLQSLSRSREKTIKRNLQAAMVVREDSCLLRERLAAQIKNQFQLKRNKRLRVLSQEDQCKQAIESFYESKRRAAREKRIKTAYEQSQSNRRLQRRNMKLQRQLFLLQNSNII